MPCGPGARTQLIGHRQVWVSFDVIEQPLPDLLHARLSQVLTDHRDLQAVAGPDSELLAPVWIEQVIAIETDHPEDQLAECLIAVGSNGPLSPAEGLR